MKQTKKRKADNVVVRSERDVTFEQAIFEWYQSRAKQLRDDPNDPDFQVRYDEHEKVFVAILEIKHSMLSPKRRKEVAEAMRSSLFES